MLTPEQRAQVVDLLADGLLVWQVAERTGVGCRAVANIKSNWWGRILGMQRARRGERIDGTPAQDPGINRPILRTRTLYCGPGRRISLRPGGPDDAMIRVALDTVWTDEAVDALCKALSRMAARRWTRWQRRSGGDRMSQVQEAISGAQRGAIFGLAKAAGLDKDALHDVVRRVTGRESIAALTMGEAIRVIDSLKREAGQEPGHRDADRPGMMTEAQRSKVYALCRTLGWVTEAGDIDMARLNGFLQARFGVARLQWVEASKAGLIINALKAMAAGGRGERKKREAEHV